MVLKALAIATLLLAVVATGCGLAIHFEWVGEIEPMPHIVLGCTGCVAGTGDGSRRAGHPIGQTITADSLRRRHNAAPTIL